MPQNDSTHDTFGFGPARSSAAEKIKQIKPVLPPDVHADLATVDAAGHNAGFVSREAPQDVEPDYRPQRMVRAEVRIAVNMRVPKPLLEAVKARAKARGVPYTRFIRETLEQAIASS